jgi:hypothetical protein
VNVVSHAAQNCFMHRYDDKFGFFASDVILMLFPVAFFMRQKLKQHVSFITELIKVRSTPFLAFFIRVDFFNVIRITMNEGVCFCLF